mmetsp:Transcript_2830/g.9445  ORF Transcript_2830/g.9445 Transcript_2830/m.9445 type:complete len:433 (+) Transcript_2830:235-1533(+)
MGSRLEGECRGWAATTPKESLNTPLLANGKRIPYDYHLRQNLLRKMKADPRCNHGHHTPTDHGSIEDTLYARQVVLCDHDVLYLTQEGADKYVEWCNSVEVHPKPNRTVNITPTDGSVCIDEEHMQATAASLCSFFLQWITSGTRFPPTLAKIQKIADASVQPMEKLHSIMTLATLDPHFRTGTLVSAAIQNLMDIRFDAKRHDIIHFGEKIVFQQESIRGFMRQHNLFETDESKHALSDLFLRTKLKDALRNISSWAKVQWPNHLGIPLFIHKMVRLFEWWDRQYGHAPGYKPSHLDSPAQLRLEYTDVQSFNLTDGHQLWENIQDTAIRTQHRSPSDRSRDLSKTKNSQTKTTLESTTTPNLLLSGNTKYHPEQTVTVAFMVIKETEEIMVTAMVETLDVAKPQRNKCDGTQRSKLNRHPLMGRMRWSLD